MASILDRYGIKEVADLTFYSIDGSTGRPRTPVLYIDTAKVSTIEQTAENVYATGGRGNARLIGWDFGKEITLNIEDAVFSPKSLSIMFGDGTVGTELNVAAKKNQLYKTFVYVAEQSVDATEEKDTEGSAIFQGSALATAIFPDNSAVWNLYKDFGLTKGDSTASPAVPATTVAVTEEFSAPGTGTKVGKATKMIAGNKYFISFYVPVKEGKGKEIVVGPDTFPGTYYITGDTYARSEADGTDEYFQFIVPKGKVTSENTITLEAEGDPSVFNMTVEVMRATVGGENVMMKLIQYGLGEGATADKTDILDTRLGWTGSGE